jgi:hypothetical protein
MQQFVLDLLDRLFNLNGESQAERADRLQKENVALAADVAKYKMARNIFAIVILMLCLGLAGTIGGAWEACHHV